MGLKIRVISLEIEKWMRVKSKYKFHSSSDSRFELNALKFMELNYFPAQFQLFTLHWFKRRGISHSSQHEIWVLLSSERKEKKVNYLIPVSVTKYLCHSLNINFKNFNDSRTKDSFFSLLLLIARNLCRHQQFWKWIFHFGDERTGFIIKYFIQFLKNLIMILCWTSNVHYHEAF